MSANRKKKLSSADRKARQAKHERRNERGLVEAVEEVTRTLTNDGLLANDIADRCMDRVASLTDEIRYSKLALDFWGQQDNPVADVLREAVAAHERYRESMTSLRERIDDLIERLDATQTAERQLEPVERYREQVRERLFSDADRERAMASHAMPSPAEHAAMMAQLGGDPQLMRGMAQRAPVNCTQRGCRGSLRYVEGTERAPTDAERQSFPGAALAFDRACADCGFRGAALQGGVDFGGGV